MHVQLFNRRPVRGRPRAKAGQSTFLTQCDVMDNVDEVPDGREDVQIAPGVVAHFGGRGRPSVREFLPGVAPAGNDYVEMPLLERLGD